ncbi:MAG: Cysteine synthase [Negativicoccus succinicivorans DORA_17_25]|uniref:Cysteine synthase n=1 Tax=Negativicoccus succinicivorans DORA_17_25 TaxID=1403945 RepID=W1TZF0_9FIRM|nr:cysteine synthase A [Negativicoccus succinicivorans]ETI84713.1 MAG: Cysteine synthase [Negativicoccus succinicivorans DORA_17_25]
MKIATSILDLVGKTPLVELKKWSAKRNLAAQIVVKLERQNPAGSVKDRVALAMIDEAEKDGSLVPGMTIVEPTSGNTGVGLAFAGAVKGYRVILVMPETMSVERRQLAQAYGAEIVLTPGAQGMQGTVDKANELKKELGNVFIPQQFENAANPAMHEATTAREIWEDTDGQVGAFVAGVGTGGTVTGVGRFLKEKDADVKIFAVEPSTSPLLTEGKAGSHKIQGIGANFIPKVLDQAVYDEVLTVTNEDAIAATQALAREEGILVGVSSGAALAAATALAQRPEFAGKRIVALLPDTGERYLSLGIFDTVDR